MSVYYILYYGKRFHNSNEISQVYGFLGLALMPNGGAHTTECQDRDYHISQVALDLNSLDRCDFSGQVQVWVRTQKHDGKLLLATVGRMIPQVQLNHAFAAGEEVQYLTTGRGE